jgi:YidC/Oxa1 family membrane protein insertase
MKDKSQLVGITLIVCAFVLMFKNASDQANQSKVTSQISERMETVHGKSANGKVNQDLDAGMKNIIGEEDFPQTEKVFILGNDVVDVVISDYGATIKAAALKKYQSVQNRPDVIVFNDGCSINAMSLTSSNEQFAKIIQCEIFDEISMEKHNITLSKTTPEGYTITRQYHLVPQDRKNSDGYVIKHTIRIENNTNSPLNVGHLFLFLDSMPATSSDSMGDYLNFGMFNGKKGKFYKIAGFSGK